MNEGDKREESSERERLFNSLRRAMKVRGMTYADLAKGLQISELSVKRLFRDKDCKMSRILDVCNLLGIRFEDLMQINQRTTNIPQFLPEEVELSLAQDKHLFTLFIFLVSQLDLKLIKSTWNIEDHELYLHLRSLEKLNLIEILSNGQFKFLVPLPIRWRLNGALGKTLQKVNENYIAYAFQNATDPQNLFLSASRLLTLSSINKLQEQLRLIRQEFDSLATQDQLFFEPKELQLYKLVTALGPFPVQDIIPFEFN